MVKIIFNNFSEDIWANTRFRIIKKLLSKAPKGRALDLGCGKGYVLQELLDMGFDAVGSDIDTTGVPQSLIKKVVKSKAENLRFKENEFNFVVCGDVLEHIKNDRLAIKEIYRVLRKDGKAIILVPAFPWLFGPHDVSFKHYRRYSKEELSNKLKDAGFRINDTLFTNSIFFLPYIFTQKIFKFDVAKSKVPTKSHIFLAKILLSIESAIRMPFGLTLIIVAQK